MKSIARSYAGEIFRRNKKNAAGRRGTRGTDDLLYIDLQILKEIKTRWKM